MSASGGTAGSAGVALGGIAAGANAIVTAFLTPNAGQTAYVSEVIVGGLGATVGGVGTLALVNLVGGTLIVPFTIPAGVAGALTPLVLAFNPPLQGSGVGTAIQAQISAFGAGNTQENVAAFGYSR